MGVNLYNYGVSCSVDVSWTAYAADLQSLNDQWHK